MRTALHLGFDQRFRIARYLVNSSPVKACEITVSGAGVGAMVGIYQGCVTVEIERGILALSSLANSGCFGRLRRFRKILAEFKGYAPLSGTCVDFLAAANFR